MATPVELEQEIENINMRSLTRRERTNDMSKVSAEPPAPMFIYDESGFVTAAISAEAPAPDLVERLRGPVAAAVQKLVNGCFRNGDGPTFHIPAQESDPDLLVSRSVIEAADELTRLTAEVERLRAALEWAMGRLDVLADQSDEAEIIRAALKEPRT